MGSWNWAGLEASVKLEDPNKKRKISQGDGFCSDSSGKYWAAKANGLAKCGEIPDYLKNESISTKEMYALENAIKLLKPGQRAIMSVDNVAVHYAFKKRNGIEKV